MLGIELKRLADAFIEELRSIRGAVENLTGTVGKQNETSSKAQDTQPHFHVSAELHTPEDVERQRTAHENRQYRLQRWITWGTWLTFIAASIYAGIAYFQWVDFNESLSISEIAARQGRIQANASQIAAKAAQDSAKMAGNAVVQARNQFIQDQRPYLWYDDDMMVKRDEQPWVESPSGGLNAGKLSASFWIKNYGKSPAIRTYSFGYLSVKQPNPEDPESWATGKLSEKGIGGVYPPGSGFEITARTKDKMSIPLASFRSQPNDSVVAAHIEIVYYDLSGNRYTSTICMAFQGNGASKRCNKEGKIQ
jgi:hypothetical protein